MRKSAIAFLPLGMALIETFSRRLQTQHFFFLSGDHFTDVLGVSSEEVEEFSAHWERLSIDHYMADGGRYRYRRYGAFNAPAHAPRYPLPHGPYEQPISVNKLNGGVPRLFDPLEPSFAEHPVLHRLLDWLTCLYDHCEGEPQHWNIRLHPYRVVADATNCGQPTPEGLHRDGVDYIVSMMLCRNNIDGGESCITDNTGTVLWQRELRRPLDIMVGMDTRTMHAVTPITAHDPRCAAYRDVLVVAFTKVLA